MNDIEKINDELRNYKLFKIQRANTRKQEFDEVREQLLKTKINELFHYFMVLVNFLSIPYLIYNITVSLQDEHFYETNKAVLFVNLAVVVFASLFVSYKLIIYIRQLQTQLTTVEKAVHYFSNESEVLKAEYETYVNHYLQQK